MTLGALVALSVGLLACGAGEEVPEDVATPVNTPAPGASVDRIVFASESGDLFTVDPDGTDLLPLSDEGRPTPVRRGGLLAQPLEREYAYTWPTWSPDGSKVAASRVQPSGDGNSLSIVVIDAETNQVTVPHRNQATQLVARTMPHYMYWSPDSRYLAFITSTEEGLALLVEDTESAAPPARVALAPPMYFCWAEDSSALLLHHGEDIKLVRAPFDSPPQVLASTPSEFRAPALSPDGTRFAYVRQDDAGNFLVMASVGDPEDQVVLTEVEDFPAFAWSPAGGEVAVVDRLSRQTTVFQRLRVVPVDGGEPRTVAEEAIASFFWSPAGDKLAWVGVDFEEGRLRWMTAEAAGGAAELLLHFQPSNAVLTMLSFFDQVAYSNSPWSPDGTRLVFAGTREPASGRQNGQTASGNRVYVVDAAGATPPVEIAQGFLAFWSRN